MNTLNELHRLHLHANLLPISWDSGIGLVEERVQLCKPSVM